MIIIDNGHGCETAGKRSPDGRLMEWSRTRYMARRLKARLEAGGAEAMLLVPEDSDVPLGERAARANAIADAGLLVSLHINAAGDGRRWMGARGWSAHVAPESGEKSRRVATIIAASVADAGISVRRPAPGVAYWQQPLAICRLTRCASVLTENLFMDNKDDCALLLDDEYIERLIEAQAAAIMSIKTIIPK